MDEVKQAEAELEAAAVALEQAQSRHYRARQELYMVRVRADNRLPKARVKTQHREIEVVITRRTKSSVWVRHAGEATEYRFVPDGAGGWREGGARKFSGRGNVPVTLVGVEP